MAGCLRCGREDACVPCFLLAGAAFDGAMPDADGRLAFQAVLERRGLPEMTEESIVGFVNDVRRAVNGTVH